MKEKVFTLIEVLRGGGNLTEEKEKTEGSFPITDSSSTQEKHQDRVLTLVSQNLEKVKNCVRVRPGQRFLTGGFHQKKQRVVLNL